jgi:glucose/arabinose dehydrogenase
MNRHAMNRANAIPLIILMTLSCSQSPKQETGTSEMPGSDGGAAAITEASAALPLSTIKLPAGFSIAIYAEVEDARSMAMSPGGTLFVGNRSDDKVYAVKDTDGDKKADRKWVIASGLNMPNGVAFRDGALYVAENSVVSRWDNIESKLANPGKPTVVYDKYPTESHHGWKYIAFGPDGKLYVPVGAPCNICEPKDPIYASITRMNPDGSGVEVYASGIRNTVGFTWHPTTNEIWFTDNNRDSMGDNVPDCELNTAPKPGMHFGYPYCHAGTVADPEFGKKRPCGDFTPPAQKMGAHVAPLGLKFYTGSMFPEAYRGHLFIAEHGSWDRSKKVGYKVSLVKLQNNKAASYETFASGWLNDADQKAWGRPVDVLLLEDGSMLVSDDRAGVIYRITYKG